MVEQFTLLRDFFPVLLGKFIYHSYIIPCIFKISVASHKKYEKQLKKMLDLKVHISVGFMNLFLLVRFIRLIENVEIHGNFKAIGCSLDYSI